MLLKRTHFSQAETVRYLGLPDSGTSFDKVRLLVENGLLRTCDIAVPGKPPKLRILRESLVEFASERGIPLAFPGRSPVLVLSVDPLVHRSFEGFDTVHLHDDALELAYELHLAEPGAVLLDLQGYPEASVKLAEMIRERQKLTRPRLIGLAPEGVEASAAFDRWLARPLTGSRLVDAVREWTEE
jgi:hypothetical protein